MDLITPLTRRAGLALLGAAAVGAGLPRSAAAAIDPELNDPAKRLEMQVKMRARLDGVRCFMPYKGTVFGKPDGETAQALYDIEGFSFAEARRVDAKQWRLISAEVGYFIDRNGGVVLDRWVNPLNGLETHIKPYRSALSSVVTADSIVRPAALLPAVSFSGRIEPPTAIDGRVWLSEDLIVGFPTPARASFADPLEYTGPRQTRTSLATWSSRRADLDDPNLAFVPTEMSFASVGNMPSAWRMGERPGSMVWRLFGVKCASIDGVPEGVRERALRDHPDFLTAA